MTRTRLTRGHDVYTAAPPRPAGSCTSIAHCPGVGHAPGAFSACRTSEDIAVPAAVLLVLREFWLDGVPAVAVPPDAPYTLTPDPTTDDSAAR